MKKEFDEGMCAFNRGTNYCTSPYTSCTIEFVCWKMGWEEALRHTLAINENPIQLDCKALDE